jgi:hypothetical protein
MTRRRVLLLGSVASVAALVIVFAVWPRSGINRWNAARIEHGMTRDEVQKILDGPPREEGGRYSTAISRLPPDVWATPDLLVCIWFDDDGRVINLLLLHDDGPLEIVRRLLHL